MTIEELELLPPAVAAAPLGSITIRAIEDQAEVFQPVLPLGPIMRDPDLHLGAVEA